MNATRLKRNFNLRILAMSTANPPSGASLPAQLFFFSLPTRATADSSKVRTRSRTHLLCAEVSGSSGKALSQQSRAAKRSPRASRALASPASRSRASPWTSARHCPHSSAPGASWSAQRLQLRIGPAVVVKLGSIPKSRYRRPPSPNRNVSLQAA